MRNKILNLVLALIVIAGGYATIAQQKEDQHPHVHGSDIPQDYGQGSFAEFEVSWENPQDTTYILTILADVDVYEVISVKYYEGFKRDARSFKPKNRDLKISLYNFHDVFIKTKMGITSINFQWDKKLGGVALLNGKIALVLAVKDKLVDGNLADTKLDLNAFANSKWEWHPVLDHWVSRQRRLETEYIDIEEEGLLVEY